MKMHCTGQTSCWVSCPLSNCKSHWQRIWPCLLEICALTSLRPKSTPGITMKNYKTKWNISEYEGPNSENT